MKKFLSILAIAFVSLSAISLQAGTVKAEEEFDRTAGLFKRTWKPAPPQATPRFPRPTPPQVLPGLPPWSQQPQGSQTPAPIVIITRPV
ncbi:hypothetical protein GCM10023213_10100 [Prosthecobacter algae]|uniref:Uncharacterized protein n=1 Tax=Prosthecobacter algae TaxID=1144682 RepID=A0ABP9NY02_9BACT